MLKEMYLPPKTLTHIIRSYWILATQPETTWAGRRFRVLPDGCPELVFHFGIPSQQKFGCRADMQPSVHYLQGIFSRHVDVQLCGEVQTLLVKIQPWALAGLLNATALQATDRQLDVQEVFPVADQSAFQRILEAGNPKAAIPLVENWLLARCRHFSPDVQVAQAVELLWKKEGQMSIHTLEKEVNLSLRRLEQKFTAHVGIGPKYYARIRRIRQTAECIRLRADMRLGDIAHDNGFFDQAHFIREFRHFAAMTPNAYARGIRGKASHYELELDAAGKC